MLGSLGWAAHVQTLCPEAGGEREGKEPRGSSGEAVDEAVSQVEIGQKACDTQQPDPDYANLIPGATL